MAPFIGNNVLGLMRVVCETGEMCLSLSTKEYMKTAPKSIIMDLAKELENWSFVTYFFSLS